ncbi:hypothetical protein N0V90_002273 [Kalmusia sp. IMI 367209]|nr:hypothetical protein N0V90_002273 [Kalmusia sp. IMI 367209]
MDPGEEDASLYIINRCKEDLFAMSVGAWRRGNDRNQIEYTIPSGSIYHEALRETIFHSNHSLNGTDYSGKEIGQGSVIKITRPPKNYSHNVLQLEYAIGKNTETFKKLWYDISLLDCAKTTALVTDVQASQDDNYNQKKIDSCPGYQNGIAMWTSDYKHCPPIYCDGVQFCDGIYNYDRSRENESTKSCDQEYRGNLYVELCAGNGNG